MHQCRRPRDEREVGDILRVSTSENIDKLHDGNVARRFAEYRPGDPVQIFDVDLVFSRRGRYKIKFQALGGSERTCGFSIDDWPHLDLLERPAVFGDDLYATQPGGVEKRNAVRTVTGVDVSQQDFVAYFGADGDVGVGRGAAAAYPVDDE